MGDAAVRFGIGDRSAIGQDVSRGPAAPVGDEIRAGTGRVALVIHFGDAGSQRSQCNHVAINQRQVVDEPAIDHLSSFRIFNLDATRFCRDLDRLVGARYLQGKVGGGVLVNVHFELGACLLVEAPCFRRHHIDSGRNGTEQISPIAVGSGTERESLLLIREDNLRSLHHGAGSIGEFPTNGSEVSLASARARQYR